MCAEYISAVSARAFDAFIDWFTTRFFDHLENFADWCRSFYAEVVDMFELQ